MSDKAIIFEDDNGVIDIEQAEIIDAQKMTSQTIAPKPRVLGLWGRLFLSAVIGWIGLVLTMAAWNFIQNLRANNPLIAQIAIGLAVIMALGILIYCIREIRAMMRLGRIEHIRQDCDDAYISQSFETTKSAVNRLARLYPDEEKAFHEHIRDLQDSEALLAFTERHFLQKKDEEAMAVISKTAQRVALVTAFIPMAFADVLAVFINNINMIRKIFEIYGGRPGFFSAWRLLGAVMSHLFASGAVAIGDDLLGSIMGGNLLSRLSRRFGEGVINAALTTRVGVVAMDICRPIGFHERKKPSTYEILGQAMASVFPKSAEDMGTPNDEKNPK